jgi:hypothetical protein
VADGEDFRRMFGKIGVVHDFIWKIRLVVRTRPMLLPKGRILQTVDAFNFLYDFSIFSEHSEL